MSRASGTRTVGRFLLSLGSLAGIAVGVPLVLVAVSQARFGSANPLTGVGAPWNGNGEGVGDGLRRPLDDGSVLDLLIRGSLVAIWCAVVVIVVVTAIETVHVVRHRGFSQPSIRGLGWAQHVARFVTAGLVVMVPLTGARPSIALDAPVAPAWSSPGDAPSRPEPAPRTVAGTVGASMETTDEQVHEHLVEAGESVYSIASDIAGGDEARTMEVADAIVDANLGAEMGPGQRFTNPAYIEVGWVLTVPSSHGAGPTVGARQVTDTRNAGATGVVEATPVGGTYVVQPGDTLWDIAEAQLGDAEAWPLIWERNGGREMDDGRTFDDPHLIVPGWTLALVDDGRSPAEVVAETHEVDEPDGVEPETTAPPEAEPSPTEPGTTAPPDAEDAEARPDVEIDRRRRPAPVDVDPDPSPMAPTIPVVSLPPSAASVPGRGPAAPTTTSTVSPAQVPGGLGTDLGGPAPEAPRPIRLEHAALVAAGLLALIGIRRRRRLRAAQPRSRVPEPLSRHVALERRLRDVDPGERVARIDVGCRAIAGALVGSGVRIGWVVSSADGDLAVRLTAPATLPPPWSCTDGATALGCEWSLGAEVPIDLLSEHARRVGDPCPALVQIGTTEDGHDVLVDLEAAGVLAVDAETTTVDDVVTAIATALASSLHAETAHLVAASLSPGAVLGHRNAHRVDGTDAAIELATALVGTTAAQERTAFELRSLGTGGEVWEPAIVLLTSDDDVLSDTVAATFPEPGHGVALVAPGGSLPGQMPVGARLTSVGAGWELRAFGGALAFTPLGASADEVAELADVVDAASEPLLSLEDLRWSDGGPALPGHERTAPADPSGHRPVDTDVLVEPGPFEPMPHQIVVGLLGPVTVTDRSGVAGSFERSKTVELIAWLTTHRERPTRTGARTALWDLDVRDATFANVVSEARRGLGRLVPPPEGEEWVGRTLSESLPLHDAVVADAQLVHERVDHARRQTPVEAIDTLRPAVEMVRDVPFSGTSYLWPDAEGITSNLVLLAITACTEFAAHALALGDTDGVFWATGRGLRVLPGHEELIGLRMRAHARSGDLAGVRQEWEAYERVVVADAWSDGEPAPKLLDLRRALLSPGATD